jgi:polyisoprenoid-binding protein YceI
MRSQRHASTHRITDAETETWTVDPGRSSLTFSLSHIVVHQIRGRFARWGGTMSINSKEPWLSSVDIWVDLGSITTGDPERDAHVRSAEFLDVARFPGARFRSKNVCLEEKRVIVEGTLDLHGVVREVELRADVEPAASRADGQERARYRARGTLDRQSFGLHWNQDLDVGGVVVGDQVELVGNVEAVRTNPRGSGDS